jgi:TolB-like protein
VKTGESLSGSGPKKKERRGITAYAVLPFKCAGGNADLAAFAEALAEEIVTGLCRFSYLRVIARSSTSRYAGATADVRTIGREVGARYTIEGSLRQAGSRLRLAVQLVDTARAAVAIVDRAIALNPGSANVWFNGGFVRLLAGDLDLAVEHLENATRLDPMGPNRGARMLYTAMARFYQRRFDEAVALLKERNQLSESPGCYLPCGKLRATGKRERGRRGAPPISGADTATPRCPDTVSRARSDTAQVGSRRNRPGKGHQSA